MAPSYSEQWDKNITTKIDVDTFWKEVRHSKTQVWRGYWMGYEYGLLQLFCREYRNI